MTGVLSLSATVFGSAEIEVLPTFPNSIGNFPTDMNESGVIVGLSYISGFNPSAVVWRNGGIKVLKGGEAGEARAINTTNEIAGTIFSHSGQPQPVIWKNEIPIKLPTLGMGGFANALNNRKEVVGAVYNVLGRTLPAIWRDGRLTLLSAPGNEDARAIGIDDSGVVCGESVNPLTNRVTPVQWSSGTSAALPGVVPSPLYSVGYAVSSVRTRNGDTVISGNVLRRSNFDQPSAVIWTNRWMRKLPDLSQIGSSEAYSTNSNGTTFGYSVDSEGLVTGVYWNDEGASRLPKLGPYMSVAYAGNSNGEIVGIGTDENGFAQPIRWRLNDLTRLSMRSFQTPRSRSITLTARAVRGSTPVSGAETEFQLNGKTVGFAKTNSAGVASLVVPVSGAKEGNHQIMASLGGSKYIFRSWVNGRSEPDLQADSASGRRNQNVTLRFRMTSSELDAPLANRRVRVWLGTREVGWGMTGPTGEGTTSFRLTNFPVGSHRLDLRFSGDGTSFGGSTTTNLEVLP
jgi:uncharacterized membrane protein